MQPHNPMLDTYRKLVGEVVDRAAPLLAKSFLISENQKDSPALARAKTDWTPVPKLLEEIDEAVRALGEAVFTISTDGRLADAARAEDIATAAAGTKTLVSTKTADIKARTSRILDGLRTDAYPARPQPADATQEARIAGIKADLRMVWDPVTDDSAFVPTMAASLRRAIGDEDALTTWLLASTHWPEDYLTSRGADLRVPVWQDEVATVLDALSPANLGDARRTYRLLADGRDGLPLLDVLFNQLERIIGDVAEWRPTTYSPTPWTRV